MFLLLVGAYGAGLLMNHSDVPKGTTVLGVDIGGGTRDDAIKKLDAAFGGRIDQPLKLNVGGRTVTLKPDQAGLHFDEDATVGKAAGSDYNPVSVIGSLFGQHREVEPEMPVDEEKLQVALENAAGGASSGSDGTIRFVSGKAVAVYGKPYKGIDVARSKQAVAQAYRTQVATGASSPVTVPTTTRQPTVSNAEVDRMMKEFAEPAMSAKVTVTTDQGKQISFSPEKSLWKFLRVKAVDGKLVDAPRRGRPEGAVRQHLRRRAHHPRRRPEDPGDRPGRLRRPADRAEEHHQPGRRHRHEPQLSRPAPPQGPHHVMPYGTTRTA
ncbi:hypothetical protein GCM10020256_25470 [Streptomyces thermocoprophilus]